MANLSGQQVYSLARAAGASHAEAIMLTAISKGESIGWNPQAYNGDASTGDKSYGLWQINMLGDMGPQRRAWFGITSNEELFNPATNAKAALLILRSRGWRAWTVWSSGAYKQYMPEAMKAGGEVGENWQGIAEQAGAGGGQGVQEMSASGTTSANVMPALPPGATPDQIEDYIRENYPQAWGFLDVPELRTILIDAAKNSWTATKLQAAMQATTWWRTNSEATRNYFAVKGTDPAQMKALIDAKVAELGPEFKQLGLTTDVRKYAEYVIQFGWTSDQIRQNLAQQGLLQSASGGLKEGGTFDLTADDIMKMARNDFFVPMDRMTAEKMAVDIYSGAKTEEQVKAYLARLGAARFPGLEESGFTPGEYMSPIRATIAEALELQPGDVDLLDKRFSKVLEYQGTDGKLRPMTVSEAQTWARSQDQYRTTKGALDEAAAFAEQITKTFGKVAS